jgi:hypothetical protein
VEKWCIFHQLVGRERRMVCQFLVTNISFFPPLHLGTMLRALVTAGLALALSLTVSTPSNVLLGTLTPTGQHAYTYVKPFVFNTNANVELMQTICREDVSRFLSLALLHLASNSFFRNYSTCAQLCRQLCLNWYIFLLILFLLRHIWSTYYIPLKW